MRRRRERQSEYSSHLEQEAQKRQKQRESLQRRRNDDEAGRQSRVTFDGNYDDDENDDVTLPGHTGRGRNVSGLRGVQFC